VRKAKASIEICGSSSFAGLQAFSTTQLLVNSGHHEFRAIPDPVYFLQKQKVLSE